VGHGRARAVELSRGDHVDLHHAHELGGLLLAGRLRTENAALVAKTREYEQRHGVLETRLHELEGVVTKLGVMAGIEKVLPDSRVGGVGGLTNIETMSPSFDTASLDGVERTVRDLQLRSKQLESVLADQRVLLASTPSIWPVRGYLSAGFGNRIDPFTGQPDFHPGIDISTPQGTKIVAPADGVVISCAVRGGYGNALIIDHGFGLVTRFAHLDHYNVRPGSACTAATSSDSSEARGARPLHTSTTRSGSATKPKTRSSTSWTSTARSAKPRADSRSASAPVSEAPDGQ